MEIFNPYLGIIFFFSVVLFCSFLVVTVESNKWRILSLPLLIVTFVIGVLTFMQVDSRQDEQAKQERARGCITVPTNRVSTMYSGTIYYIEGYDNIQLCEEK